MIFPLLPYISHSRIAFVHKWSCRVLYSADWTRTQSSTWIWCKVQEVVCYQVFYWFIRSVKPTIFGRVVLFSGETELLYWLSKFLLFLLSPPHFIAVLLQFKHATFDITKNSNPVIEGGGGIVMDVPLFNSRRKSVPNILSKIVACMHLLLRLCTMYIIV